MPRTTIPAMDSSFGQPQQQINLDSLSAGEKQELQQSFSNEMQKAKIQEGTTTAPFPRLSPSSIPDVLGPTLPLPPQARLLSTSLLFPFPFLQHSPSIPLQRPHTSYLARAAKSPEKNELKI